MQMSTLMQQVKSHPDIARAGMILCHNGVVRENTREGEPVTGLTLSVDHERLEQILSEHRKRPGIVDIRVHIFEDTRLSVGDDIMFLIVAGDIRENVIQTLSDTLNRIKSEVTRKTQFHS